MKNLSFLIILLSILVVNCKKGHPDILPVNPDFPNSIGNKLIYKVVDSTTNATYNVIVSIIGKTTLPNDLPVIVWTYTYPNTIDTNYVFCNKDSVVFFNKSKSAVINTYHFPLVVGGKWRNTFLGDSCKVVATSSLTTQSGTFTNTYLIKESAFSPNYHLTKNEWYVPKIGLVKMNFREFNFGSVNAQSWELISYNLN